MKKFIKNFILFFGGIIVLSFIFDMLITHGLRKSNLPFFNEWNLIYSGSINADLIINGSSKAHYHVSPKIIDSVLNLNSFNLAIDGHPYLMQNKKYEIYRKYNKSPKTVVQIVSYGTFSTKEKLTDIKQFLPYLNDSIIVNNVKKYKYGFSKVDFYLPLIKYIKYLDAKDVYSIILNYFGIKSKFRSKNYKGYFGEDKVWNSSSFEKFKKNNRDGITVNLDSNSVDSFVRFLRESKKKNINVVLVYPPSYFEFHKYVNNRKEIIDFYKELTEKHDLTFIDYSKSRITLDKIYFYNTGHLNKKGARLFSLILAHDLKKTSVY